MTCVPPAILVLSSTYPRGPGDSEPAFVQQLARELQRSYRVHVLAPHSPGAATDEVEAGGVRVHRFRYHIAWGESLAYGGGILAGIRRRPWRVLLVPVFLAAELAALVRLQRRYRFSLWHAHWLVPQGCIAGIARAWLGYRVPLLVTAHGGDLFALHGRLWNAVRRWVLRRADALTTLSETARRAALALGAEPEKLTVAPMGVDLERTFVPPAPGSERRDVVFVGRLVASKGVGCLLQAMATLWERHPDTRLVLVGRGPEEEALRRRAEALGAGDRVVFAGAVPSETVADFFRSARVAVMPSLEAEGLGLVAVEALGCGCPVVASDQPSLREFVVPGKHGQLVPPGDAAALAAALEQLLGDPVEAERLGAAGRTAVRERFDWSVAGARYRALCDALLSKASATVPADGSHST